jgi:hypothetical protein
MGQGLKNGTTGPLYADDRNFYKVELWTKDRLHMHRAKQELGANARKRPRAVLTIRQRARLLDECPVPGGPRSIAFF